MSEERVTGYYQTISTIGNERVQAFVPHPLPPDPPLQLTNEDYDLIEKANRALGRLDGLSSLLPETTLFTYMYIRKEAVLSSQIEGTQSSLSDLLSYEAEEAPGIPLDDVQEVSRYVAAMEYGLDKIRNDDWPLCVRIIKEMHEVLLSEGRGQERRPGEFRQSQNWIGGTRPGTALYVPPPQDCVIGCMGDLEKFWNNQPTRTPTLLKAALSHVQFETIHPFLDGNGRLGRLLITLLLCHEGALEEPILYLSLYFKTNKQIYYEHLQAVRTHGDWEGWVRFFLQGVLETAQQAVSAARSILAVFEEDKRKLSENGCPASVLRVYEFIQKRPLVTIKTVAEKVNVSIPTATKAINLLETLEIVREVTGKQRGKLYTYDRYMRLLNEGTEVAFD